MKILLNILWKDLCSLDLFIPYHHYLYEKVEICWYLYECCFFFASTSQVKAQFLGEYEKQATEIIQCNSNAIDSNFIAIVAVLLRLRFFFAAFLVIAAIAIGTNARILKITIIIFIAFAGVDMTYKLGIKPHMEMAKDLSSWASSSSLFSNSTVTGGLPPINNGGNVEDGTDITRPPLGNGGNSNTIILSPPPPLLEDIDFIPPPGSSC